MSWADGRRHALRGVAVALAVALSACGIRPLYGTLGTPDGGPAPKLAAVDVNAPPHRIGLRLKNELIFAFTGGGEGAPKAYRLELVVSDQTSPVGVERVVNLPGAYIVQLTATYALVDVASGRTLTTGTTFANASFDFSTQRFANERARLDAENRAVGVLAEDIRTRLAAFFATQG